MARVAERPPVRQIPPTAEEREEAPALEGLRQVLRVVLVISLALTAVLAVFPLLGTLLLPAVFAALAYAGLMLVTWVERRRWQGRHAAPAPRHGEVGFHVVAGDESTATDDRGDATVDHEGVARRAGATTEPLPPVGAAVPGPGPALEEGEVGRAELFTAPQRAGIKVIGRIAAIILVMALALAAAVFNPQLLGVGAVIVVAYMALFGMPVWLASVEDAAEEKKRQQVAARRRHPARP
ncbi:MAG: hypothetical protein M9894_08010 [Planctomycetes bacterium]|nr:hypothetical protein [Planctomycetota bacterium]